MKKVIKGCFGCKIFQAAALRNPPPGNFQETGPREDQRSKWLASISLDLKYRKGKKNESKAYIVFYMCSLARGIFLELLLNLETSEFMTSLKRLIARRGRPERIYSDNGRTFVGAANLLRIITGDERLHDYLVQHEIKWQFNLSRAPWWGGQFE